MEYVRDELRPRLLHALPKDEFIREAMSTSFINKGIMKRFDKRFPDYIYRRVAINPMNPKNGADEFETGYIKKFFISNNSKKEWKGLVEKNGKGYFIHLKAVVMEEQCIMCHGDPSFSPASLIQRYGKDNGHYWKVGDVVGLESISIPVDETFYEIRRIAFSVFLLGLTGTVALFLILNYFYYTVAVRPLKKVSSFFKSVVSGQKGLDVRFDVKGQDEISEVAESFNQMVSHLKKSQDDLMTSEAKLKHAEKLASIGQLAAGVAHEINNPLSVILGYTRMLTEDCPANEQIKEDLAVVQNNARLCKKIVEDLLNFSRQTKIQPVDVDVNSIIESVVSSLEVRFNEKDIEIVRHYDPVIPVIKLDVDKMKQVFVNLLVNAYDAIESSGVIDISTHNLRDGIMIVFSDTGRGIPEGIRNRIFEPFFTTKEPGQGTGLGLAVSYGIIKEHSGEISVESEEGNGTTFKIWLPLKMNGVGD
jgi:signal transduction histidine kinase